MIRACGIHISEQEYGRITLLAALRRALRGFFRPLILKYCMYSVILSPLNYRLIRPKLWSLMGVKVGKNVFIGYDVWMDFNNAEKITLEDGVHIANRCLILCHQRDLSEYHIGDDYGRFGYNKERVLLKRGCLLGMGTMVMPGVTVGEGSLIGAGSIVTKDIPDWVVAIGRPAKVVRKITERERSNEDKNTPTNLEK